MSVTVEDAFARQNLVRKRVPVVEVRPAVVAARVEVVRDGADIAGAREGVADPARPPVREAFLERQLRE
jgi:hypothetical protein